MNKNELYNIWKHEEKIAHIVGWDFSHIQGRYEAENDLPWDYEKIVRSYLQDSKQIMDYDHIIHWCGIWSGTKKLPNLS